MDRFYHLFTLLAAHFTHLLARLGATSRLLLCATVLLLINVLMLIGRSHAAEIAPLVSSWTYSANQCSNWAGPPRQVWECANLDGGIRVGTGTNSDPHRCIDQAHARPWSVESMIEQIVETATQESVTLEGWLNKGESTYCTGFFDTASITETLGTESSNFSLLTVGGNPGLWGARRDRNIDCPVGTSPAGDRCVQWSIADPYKSFDICLNNGTNPVNVFMGEKNHTETDFRGVGPNPIVFKRYYSSRSGWRFAKWETSEFGEFWRHNYSGSIQHFKSDSFERVTVIRDNGNRYYFEPVAEGTDLTWRATDPDVTGRLNRIVENDDEYWVYRTAQGAEERYRINDGRLHSIRGTDGQRLSFTYDALNRLSGIDNGFGRGLILSYHDQGPGKGLIQSIAASSNGELVAGSQYFYEYENTDRTRTQIMLDKVIYPDMSPEDLSNNPFKDYLYNEADHVYWKPDWEENVEDGPSTHAANVPFVLTGIVDENGDRYATYKYQKRLFAGGSYYLVPVWGGHGSPNASGTYADQYTITQYHPTSNLGDGRANRGYARIKDALGRSRDHHFDLSHGVLRPTQISGGVCEFCDSKFSHQTYDAATGFLDSRMDYEGNQTLYAHNERGLEICRIEGVSSADPSRNALRRIISEWDPTFGVATKISVFEPAGSPNITACLVDDDAGWQLRKQTTYTYLPQTGLITQRVERSFKGGTEDAPRRSTLYSYYAPGNDGGMPMQLKSIDGPRDDVNDVTYFRYATSPTSRHNAGDLIEVTNALGHVIRYTRHDEYGRVLEMTDANGLATQYQYHPRGWLLSQVVDGAVIRYEYDNAGQLIRQYFAHGGYLSKEYDDAHRLISVTDNFGNSTRYQLDPMGNILLEKTLDPSGTLRRQAQQVFNDLNQLEKNIQYTDPATTYTEGYWYDNNGKQVRRIDPRDPEMNAFTPIPVNPSLFSQQIYDARGRLIHEIDNLGGQTERQYDVFGNLVSLKEPGLASATTAEGLGTSYEYNGFGDLISIDSPDTGITRYRYDQAGNRVVEIKAEDDAAGREVQYRYDALNRLIAIDYDSSDRDVAYQYDGTGDHLEQAPARGRLTRVNDESGQTDYIYDARGNVIRTDINHNGSTNTVGYVFNQANQLIRTIYPSGREIEYVYQSSSPTIGSDLVQTIKTSLNGETKILVDNVKYLPFGPVSSHSFGNGLLQSLLHDLSYRVTRVKHTENIDRIYQYDLASNIMAMTDQNQQTQSQSFQYDSLNRLTQAIGEYGSFSYAYDSIGNRRQVQRNSDTSDYQYGTNTHHLLTTDMDKTSINQFDLNGNLIRNGSSGEKFNYGIDNRLKGVERSTDVMVTYRYNAMGQRVVKMSDKTTLFYYDLHGRLIAEMNDQGTSINEYVYLEGKPVAMLEAAFPRVFRYSIPEDRDIYVDIDLNTESLRFVNHGVISEIKLLNPLFEATEVSNLSGEFTFSGFDAGRNYFSGAFSLENNAPTSLHLEIKKLDRVHALLRLKDANNYTGVDSLSSDTYLLSLDSGRKQFALSINGLPPKSYQVEEKKWREHYLPGLSLGRLRIKHREDNLRFIIRGRGRPHNEVYKKLRLDIRNSSPVFESYDMIGINH